MSRTKRSVIKAGRLNYLRYRNKNLKAEISIMNTLYNAALSQQRRFIGETIKSNTMSYVVSVAAIIDHIPNQLRLKVKELKSIKRKLNR